MPDFLHPVPFRSPSPHKHGEGYPEECHRKPPDDHEQDILRRGNPADPGKDDSENHKGHGGPAPLEDESSEEEVEDPNIAVIE